MDKLVNDYFVLYTVLGVFCLLIILVILTHSRVGIGISFKDKVFRIALFLLIVLNCLDLLYFYIMHNYIPFNIVLAYTIKSLYYFVGSISGFLWFLYFEAELESKIVKEKTPFICSMFLIFASLVMLIINIWVPFLFKIDKEGANTILIRGNLFILIYACIFIYVLVSCIRCLIRAFDPKYYAESSRLLVYASFPLIPLIAGSMQYNFQMVPITVCSLTLTVMIMYMVDVANQISQDSLTELNNRRNFMRVLQRSVNSIENDVQLYLLMLDLNEFKSINDNYGHVEGDHALIVFSEVLKKCISSLKRRGILARYGGDEFIVMLIVDDESEVIDFINFIKNELINTNHLRNKGYNIETSVGYKRYDESMNIKELIDYADQELYIDKQKNKK